MRQDNKKDNSVTDINGKYQKHFILGFKSS